MTKPVDTLKTIARYIEAKKPKTLGEAEHQIKSDARRFPPPWSVEEPDAAVVLPRARRQRAGARLRPIAAAAVAEQPARLRR